MSDDRIEDFFMDEQGDELVDDRSDEVRRRDERLDAMVRGAALDYHRPPAAPRDAMWDAIQHGLRTDRPAPIVAAVPGLAHGEGHANRFRAPRYAAYALAASLLLAAGIGIGMRIRSDGGAPVAIASHEATPTERAPRDAAAFDTATRDTSDVPRDDVRSPSGIADERGSRLADVGRDARRAPGEREVAARGTTRAGNASYGFATVRHLTQVEALLTSFDRDASGRTASTARSDAQVSAWARELLTNTRLLLDSPAADDPLRARLLEDLELVLVQIVQLGPGTAVDDRASIERTMSRGHVMTRLRTAIPAGQSSGI